MYTQLNGPTWLSCHLLVDRADNSLLSSITGSQLHFLYFLMYRSLDLTEILLVVIEFEDFHIKQIKFSLKKALNQFENCESSQLANKIIQISGCWTVIIKMLFLHRHCYGANYSLGPCKLARDVHNHPVYSITASPTLNLYTVFHSWIFMTLLKRCDRHLIK